MSLNQLTKTLKPLPRIITEIGEACFDDDVEYNELAELIEQDAIVTGKLLRHINSPYYGMMNKITTVKQALALLGKKNTYAFVISSMIESLIPDVDIGVYGIETPDTIHINKLRGKLLENWCKELGIPRKSFETINTISIVMVLGTYLSAKALDYNLQYNKFRELKDTDELHIIEKKLLDYSSHDINAKLFDAWHFPEVFVWVAKMMPLFRIEQSKTVSSIKSYAFIITLVHKIIRIDGNYTMDLATLKIVNENGFDAGTLERAWKNTFGYCETKGRFDNLLKCLKK